MEIICKLLYNCVMLPFYKLPYFLYSHIQLIVSATIPTYLAWLENPLLSGPLVDELQRPSSFHLTVENHQNLPKHFSVVNTPESFEC